MHVLAKISVRGILSAVLKPLGAFSTRPNTQDRFDAVFHAAMAPASHLAATQSSIDKSNPLVKYKLLSQVGKGSYGKVYRAVNRATDATVAVKVIRLQDDAEIQDLTAHVRREVDTLRRCDSAFIVSYLGSHVYRGRLWLLTEFCEGGSLLDALTHQQQPLSEAQVAAVMAGTLCALQHLHQECHMLHRDVKAANLLLMAGGSLKLADFGVSVQLSNTLSMRSTAIGTPHWMAPEVIQEGEYSALADVWSLGISAIELAERHPPLWELRPVLQALFRIPRDPAPTLSRPDAWSGDFVAWLHC